MRVTRFDWDFGWHFGLVLLLGPAVIAHVAWSQPPSLTGRVGTLPGTEQAGAENPRPEAELLEGHVHLLATSMEQAIEDLQHAELKAFAKSYQRMVEAYNQLADHIGDAAAAIGDAETQISFAKRNLQAAEEVKTVDPNQRRKLGEDIGQIRAMLMGKLAATRTRYEQADDEQERNKMLRQLHGLVSRVKQLDTLSSSLTSGSRPILPGLASREMREQLDAIQESLAEEEQMLGVVSESVRMLVASTTTEMRRTMSLLQVEASIPRQQLLELSRTRTAVGRVMDQVAAAHQKAAAAAGAIITDSEPNETLPSAQELLRETDRLLNRAKTP